LVDGKTYHVRVDSHTVFRYYMHEDWRSVVFEQVSTYDVNGVKGYGIAEFLYRSVILLPVEFCFFVDEQSVFIMCDVQIEMVKIEVCTVEPCMTVLMTRTMLDRTESFSVVSWNVSVWSGNMCY